MSKRKAEPASSPAEALASELGGLFGKLKRRLREQASAGDLTPSQIAVLVHLDREGPATVSALARLESVRPQSMGATVASLEALALVRGSPDPTDGRQTILSLTPRCQEMIRSGRAARHEWLLRAIQSKLTQQEQAQLKAALPLLNRIVETE
ncbi:MarR family transcriptional regulator [Bradyrhizobium sp. ARR65]|uniref:MarR family winged helix-turn-helix transcriptional regulator n=1 Tax=Bradyrhizobium sp. ARR65 TaxID=1040989 RepID=UPI000463CB6F|nr:MarR family transcriptional regulator [Bradyrhizobium sp. ARR65]